MISSDYFIGWQWGRESSFDFVRHEQNQMCLNLVWLFILMAYNVFVYG